MFWFYVLPLGFLLTLYTITGFDASAHISEETHGAAMGAAKGVWRSVFYRRSIGWIVLLAITFAATDVGRDQRRRARLGSSLAIFTRALTPAAAKVVILISHGRSALLRRRCLTSASRMCFAFSRDRGFATGLGLLSKVNTERVPVFAVTSMALLALLITLPALRATRTAFPYAFFAVVSIS